MSDSETCCSCPTSVTAESPELYIGAMAVENGKMAISSQFDDCNTIAALNELDSMLEYPCSQIHCTLPGVVNVPRSVVSNSMGASSIRLGRSNKCRSIHQLFQQLSSRSISCATLKQILDINEMRLLLNSCGIKPFGSTKAHYAEQLFTLHQSGSLTLLRNQVLGASNVLTAHIPDGVTFDAEISVIERTAVKYRWEDDNVNWRQIQDVALQDALNSPDYPLREEMCPSNALGVFLASMNSGDWRQCSRARCDLDMQDAFELSDRAEYVVSSALTSLNDSKSANKFSAMDLSPCHIINLDHQDMSRSVSPRLDMEALRKSLIAATELVSKNSKVDEVTNADPGAAHVTMLWDCLKVVRFHREKLGLALIPMAVSATATTAATAQARVFLRVVIQMKYPSLLEPQVDRLLCVGDELVCVQGQSLQRFGTSFKSLLDHLKASPRPIKLGFLSGSSHY